MKDSYQLALKCVLCRVKYDTNLDFKNIEQTRVSGSGKSIKDILNHLAKCIKGEIIVKDSSSVCGPCYEKLSEYDEVMLQLLVHQKELCRLLEISMNTLDLSDEEKELIIKEEAPSEGFLEIPSDMDNDLNEEPTQETKQGSSTIAEEDSSFKCSICDKKLSSKSSLRIHLSTHSKAKVCRICGAVRRDEEYLELHMNIHEGKSEKECRYCPKQYSRRSHVIRHMHLHWDKKKYQCEKCGLRFSQTGLLNNHKMHHDAEEQPLVCSKCDQTFKSKKTFNHHMLKHSDDRPMYPCEMCGKKFTEKYTLKMHLKTHKDPSEEDLDSVIKHNATLKKRQAQKEFPCIICNKILTSKDILDSHMTDEHDVIS